MNIEEEGYPNPTFHGDEYLKNGFENVLNRKGMK